MKNIRNRNFHGKLFLKTLLPAVFACAFPAGGFCLDLDIKPVNVDEAEYARLKDRIGVSLFFRGELADKFLAAGLRDRLLGPAAGETYADTKEALIGWIQKNPDQAANLYFYLRGNGAPGALRSEIKYSMPSWEINPRFLALLSALNSAARDKGLSDEALNLAGGRLFEGPQAGAEAGVPAAGGRGGRGSDFFSAYADYRLNRAGLERELKNLRAWTDSLREGFERATAPPQLSAAFEEAFSAYGAFTAGAAALKPRSALTAAESAALERERRFVRNKLAALTLLELAERVDRAAGTLEGADAGFLEEARVLSGSLGQAAGKFAEGLAGPGELGRVLTAAERSCGLFCARAAALRALLALRLRLERTAGFSCVYDYLLHLGLTRFAPSGAYAKARGVLRGGGLLLDRSGRRLENGGWNEAGGSLEAGLSEFGAALETVEKAAAFNKRAQFFLWGILFRPLELEVSLSRGRPALRPVFAFYGFIGPRPGNGISGGPYLR